MKRKHTWINKSTLTALAAPVALLMACGASDASAEARTLHEANAIYVEGKQCRDGVIGAMAERNIGVISDPEKADSTLTVDVTTQGRNLDDVPAFGGVGNKASYSATLTGAEDKVLFSTAGEEGSINHEEMCQDIGDEIASRLKERRNI